MKKLISFLLILTLLALSLVSCGDTTDDGDGKQESLAGRYSRGLAYEVSATSPNECIITGIGSCTDTNIVIPSYINGMRVVGIADGAFSPKSELTALARPSDEVSIVHESIELSLSGIAYDGFSVGNGFCSNGRNEPYSQRSK